MCPETWCELALTVSCNNEAFLELEEFLCNDSCLGESMHTTTNFAEHVPIVVNLVEEIVLVDNVLGEEVDIHSEVLIAFHECHQIEIFDVDGHEFGVFCGYFTVEE